MLEGLRAITNRRQGGVALEIAIDGPAGAGKSTIARLLSRRLNLNYLDTGAMYRAFTLKVVRTKMDLDDLERVQDLLHQTDLEIIDESSGNRVIMDGEEVTEEIRDARVNQWVSPVSAMELVREAMVDKQRAMARKWGGVIMDGRDIGTCVLPHASHKFYLDASLDERVRRRYQELQEKGKELAWHQVKEEIINRDRIDKERSVSPLMVASDAVVIDTTGLNIEEVVQEIVKHLTPKTA